MIDDQRFLSLSSPEVFGPVADAFVALIKGEASWDAATSPVL
jgi:hypothetical protein